MIGKRKPQPELFDVGNVYSLHLAPGGFHAQLARASSRLFSDEDFVVFYSEKVGRPSVPPSMLALTLLLQHEAQVSDEEAVARTGYDLRWAAVLGRPAGEPLCAKSTLQLFRAHLILHDEIRRLFQASIQEAKRTGLLRGQSLRVALDTKPITGRGAVLDTYNLLAGGIRKLAEALARSENQKLAPWLCAHGLTRFAEPSIKGASELDWSDPQSRDQFLSEIVSDARRLMELARDAGPAAKAASDTLASLLLQDIDMQEDASVPPNPSSPSKSRLKRGFTTGRSPSLSEPEQRHGHKSENRLFVGYKASVAADTESQIIVAADVIPADAGDASGALFLVEEAETNTSLHVQETIGDCAYGGGPTRQAFADADRELIARVPSEWTRDGLFSKSAFAIDLENQTVTCPAGHKARYSCHTPEGGRKFFFGAVCGECPLRSGCTRAVRGRTIQVHAQEARIKAARIYQQTAEGRRLLRKRMVVEHRLARLGQLGIGQARYIGQIKTRFQLLMAAAIANLRRSWNWEESQTSPNPILQQDPTLMSKIPNPIWDCLSQMPTVQTAWAT